ncbi:unnamed protein product [Cyprideis torosa]|uniref:Uncharacterized protein n=1 Tax=Cyprideis torosa TaxID=163714 RepID=A0A7R8ZG84_9CRUS|nr:unnamed protein product [Cyprideis torosa]CAG0879491.1 unnamed protein product [Cyprideis torosa]
MALSLEAAFSGQQITADLSISSIPKKELAVIYPPPNHTVIETGKEYTPDQTSEEPVRFEVIGDEASDKLYTLMMIDPDAPSRENPKFRSWMHYLVMNVPVGQHGYLAHKNGDLIVEYMGPKPPAGTKQHRYIFLLFEQGGKRLTHSKSLANNRKSFNLAEFLKQHSLGVPSAGNFFLAQNH